MEKEQNLHHHRHKDQEAKREKKQSQLQHEHPNCCSNCHAPVPEGARFCANCGAPQGCACGHCGAQLKPGLALCPVCGQPVTTNCTFCGASMNAGQAFCPECGNPRAGITCPQCGTMNYRSFCRTCNHPLNQMALYAVKQAESDPRYIRAKKVAEEIQAIEDEIEQIEAFLAQPDMPEPIEIPAQVEEKLDTTIEVSEETRKMLEEFAQLSGKPVDIPQSKPKPQQVEEKKDEELTLSLSSTPVTTQTDVVFGTRKARADASARLEQLKAQHQAKLAEFQAEIDAMIPDPNDPPEIQRNFACAHMIKTYGKTTTQIKVRQRVAWICNECHVRHNNPSECGVAEFGGKWVYEDKIITTTTETISSGTINY